ncbi:MAG: tetratricopeptide repeat protein [Pseudomonadota bacterium]
MRIADKFAVASLLALGIAIEASASRPIHYGAVSDTDLLDCDRIAWRGDRAAASGCYSNLLAAADDSVRAEAAWALGDRQAANRWFRSALAAAPDDLDLKTRWAELFASTHQDADAIDLFREVLADDPKHPFATVGAATILAGNFESNAEARIAPLLTDDDAASGARLRAALLSARFALERGDRDNAALMLDLASDLAKNNDWPELDVHALRVAMDVLAEDFDSDFLASGVAANPSYGALYAEAAYFLTITRHYRLAIEWLERAIAAEPNLASAHEMLGVNLLRDNRIGAAREHLETAYELDPFSPVAVNTLRLLDSFDRFTVVRDEAPTSGRYRGQPPLELRLRNDEVDVLAALTIELTREAIEVFTARYRFELSEPVVIEMYPDHEDFAVRTAGMPGLGILGATFGYVVAMDSPSGRPIDQFQWGTVLWHELAHVFTLEATAHRVPRWFSEGISVYEEWRSGPNPGVRIPPGVLSAIDAGNLLPIDELDSGFVRPTYPNQVIVSYMQAGLICDYIAARFGSDKLAAVLNEFGAGADTASAIERSLDVDTASFDRDFLAWVEANYGELYGDIDGWQDLKADAHAAFETGDFDTAIDKARRATELYPGYVEPDAPWLTLAQAASAVGDATLAETTYDAWLAQGGYAPGAITDYANALYAAGKKRKAAETLARIDWVAPLATDHALTLGEWWIDLGEPDRARDSLGRVLALEPHDRASVLYLKARAELAAGDREAARATLLDALEIAPAYRDAQKLLLELVRTGS